MSETDLRGWAINRLLIGLRTGDDNLVQRSAELILILAQKRVPETSIYIPSDKTIEEWEKRGLKILRYGNYSW
jgi:hypothetical protein